MHYALRSAFLTICQRTSQKKKRERKYGAMQDKVPLQMHLGFSCEDGLSYGIVMVHGTASRVVLLRFLNRTRCYNPSWLQHLMTETPSPIKKSITWRIICCCGLNRTVTVCVTCSFHPSLTCYYLCPSQSAVTSKSHATEAGHTLDNHHVWTDFSERVRPNIRTISTDFLTV